MPAVQKFPSHFSLCAPAPGQQGLQGLSVFLLCVGVLLCTGVVRAQPATLTPSPAPPTPALPPALVAPLMALPSPRNTLPPALPDDVSAADQPAGAASGRWVLGMTVASSPSFSGGSRELGFRPVLAGRLGRWMVATSTARGMAGRELVGGLSTTVAETDRVSVGLGVRTTHGRDSGDGPLLRGLPGVPASLALRASARYTLAPDWRLTAAWQQDVLKSQGGRFNVGAGWSKHVAGDWLLDISTGLTWANSRTMNTFYGVPTSASRPDRPAWNARAGWEQWGWGVGVSRALSTHWRLSGSLGHSTLLGDAAHSPLTARTTGTQAQLSVAYVGW